MKLIIAACAVLSLANAMPHYIAVPSDQIQFIDLRALHVHSRPARQAAPAPQYDEQQYEPLPYRVQASPEDTAAAASDERPARHAHQEVGDYVDFGAHTGQHGAFGWYADYPVDGGHH